MGMTDLAKSNGSASTSKAPAKSASSARKTRAAAPKSDDVPIVGYAVLNGGGKAGLVWGPADVVRKGATVKAVSKAGKGTLVIVGDTLKVNDQVYGLYTKAA